MCAVQDLEVIRLQPGQVKQSKRKTSNNQQNQNDLIRVSKATVINKKMNSLLPRIKCKSEYL